MYRAWGPAGQKSSTMIALMALAVCLNACVDDPYLSIADGVRQACLDRGFAPGTSAFAQCTGRLAGPAE